MKKKSVSFQEGVKPNFSLKNTHFLLKNDLFCKKLVHREGAVAAPFYLSLVTPMFQFLIDIV